MTSMPLGTCHVCFEEVKQRLSLPALRTGNGDTLREGDCRHPICISCLASHVAARVEDQRVFGIRCPAVGCKSEVYEQDLHRLVECGALAQSVLDQFTELRSRDYHSRAREFAEAMSQAQTAGEYALLRRLWESTRLCPRCGLAIEKSQGCNSFYCICGHHFDYQSAPRAVGNGAKNFGKLIALAQDLSISVNEAEKYGDWKLYFKAGRTASALSLTMEQACELHKQAQSGDEGAREQIQRARAGQKARQPGGETL
eukprot:CAMPEP_0179123074 /NCGR_PEP_ID=MMETSP0796-20121207/58111_1 /TAXON_ID=73915 /ORGANISM="Pyrodinium bahamense, Strain pbaha01" /LENGTH=255 /DNA_ID=CAMNT_0020821711 /DNA_START=66 /DNA_END=833 /DNA_ORIENTATION=+